ncbi:OsmC family protein [Algoriella sp.]|uniref:OsmC family protein n=1 Tax=Algoriella sp. TaxID=1872434 RepID=UPI002FC9A4B3
MAFKVKESKNEVDVNASLGSEKYITTITSNGKQIIGDEPEHLGGKNTGFNPYEFLVSALSMCTAATLRVYAERKEIDLGEINVSVNLSNNTIDKVATFTKHISFGNKDLDEKDIKRLQVIAESCPVNRLLTNQIIVNTNIDL